MDELRTRHRHEQRELQGRVTSKKKNATKKTRKAVNDECTELERQLAERQQQELNELDLAANAGTGVDRDVNAEHASSAAPDEVDKLVQTLNGTSIATPEHALPAVLQAKSKKPNRQKARLARRAAEKEAAVAEASLEAAGLPDRRAEEQAIMARELAKRGLVEKEVRSDGHCMYAAVADQLTQVGRPLQFDEGQAAYAAVRRDAANFVSTHVDDFAPFLDEPCGTYVHKIRDTAEWGGQLELSALARAYGIRIQVLQGDGRVETITADGAETEIWLAYYRHSFGLGEHYNSLRVKTS